MTQRGRRTARRRADRNPSARLRSRPKAGPIDYQFAIKALVLLGAVFFDVTSKGKDA
jgi:hypothetical protein